MKTIQNVKRKLSFLLLLLIIIIISLFSFQFTQMNVLILFTYNVNYTIYVGGLKDECCLRCEFFLHFYESTELK